MITDLKNELAAVGFDEPPPPPHKRNGRGSILPKLSRPRIVIGTDESRVVNEAIAALSHCENVFQRGQCLVQVLRGAESPRGIARRNDAPRIAPIKLPRLRELLAGGAVWLDAKQRKRKHPPDWAVRAVDARQQWPGLKRLEAVVEAPILRVDGSILQTPGYDEATGIYYAPAGNYPAISEKPTFDDASAAVAELQEVVADFPFATDAHRSACIAGMLTPFARHAFDGPAPLFFIDANSRGAGKTLAADTAGMIATGRPMARMAMPESDGEMRKRITALAVEGEPLVLIDNVSGHFGSPSLDAALTATSWSDRRLGETAMVSALPLYCTWLATGNNVSLAGDIVRRICHIRLESPLENPEERSGFRHPDLLAWTSRNRPRLVAAALTILAAYFAAGKPDMELSPWGSYEGWSGVVRNVIAWAGLADPGATRRELSGQADRETVALRQLISAMRELDPCDRGLTVMELLVELSDRPANSESLRAALMEIAPPRDGRSFNPRSIGMKLHHLRNRVVAGYYLDRRDSNRGAVWHVKEASDSRGTSDTNSITRKVNHKYHRVNETSPFSPVSVTAGTEEF